MNEITKAWRSKAQVQPFTGRLAVVPVNYPATPWTRYINYGKLLLGRPGVNWDGLTRSESAGVAKLKEAISKARASCPERFVGIAGYSQGADVISRTLQDENIPDHRRIAVALVGNPSYDDFEGNRGIRPSLNAATYTIPDDILTRDYCYPHDALCNFSLRDVPGLLNRTSGHYRYAEPGPVKQVTDWLYSRATANE